MTDQNEVTNYGHGARERTPTMLRERARAMRLEAEALLDLADLIARCCTDEQEARIWRVLVKLR